MLQSNNYTIGTYNVGQRRGYIHSGIEPNTAYKVTVKFLDAQETLQMLLNSNDSASGRATTPNSAHISDIITQDSKVNNGAQGTLSNFIINSDGTLTFTMTSGASSNDNLDCYDILVNGTREFTFWINEY